MINKPKKYLFTSNTYASLYNFRKDIIENYISDGATVYLLAPLDTRYIDYFTQLGCICLSLKMGGKSKNPISEIRLYLQYRRIYRKIKPDIVFHYTIKPNIYGNIAAGRQKIRSAVFITGLGSAFTDSGFTNKIALMLYKLSFPYAKKIIVLNQDDFDLVKEKIPKIAEKLYILPSEGIKLDDYNPTPQNNESSAFTFLMAARALKEKGLVEYAKAASIMKNEYPNVTVAFMGEIGSQNDSAIPESTFNLWIKEGALQYWGYDKNIQTYIDKSDCVVLPTFYREGVPIVLLEALAMKKPIITTNAPGCKDVIKDGLNGYNCEGRNVDSLVSAMKKMISLSKEERIRMGDFGRKQVEENYNMDIIWSHYKLIESHLTLSY